MFKKLKTRKLKNDNNQFHKKTFWGNLVSTSKPLVFSKSLLEMNKITFWQVGSLLILFFWDWNILAYSENLIKTLQKSKEVKLLGTFSRNIRPGPSRVIYRDYKGDYLCLTTIICMYKNKVELSFFPEIRICIFGDWF